MHQPWTGQNMAVLSRPTVCQGGFGAIRTIFCADRHAGEKLNSLPVRVAVDQNKDAPALTLARVSWAKQHENKAMEKLA